MPAIPAKEDYVDYNCSHKKKKVEICILTHATLKVQYDSYCTECLNSCPKTCKYNPQNKE